MCRNGRYTERGIKERHGYGAERFRVEPEFVVKIDPALGTLGVLLEPASILARRGITPSASAGAPGCGSREACWSPERAQSVSSPP
jgi:hypothetical protein